MLCLECQQQPPLPISLSPSFSVCFLFLKGFCCEKKKAYDEDGKKGIKAEKVFQ